MAAFVYKALRTDGSLVEGRIEGASRGDAMRKVGASGLQLVSIGEAAKEKPLPGKQPPRGSERAMKEKPPRAAPSFPGAGGGEELRLKSGQLIQFTEELSDLLGAGVQLDSALESIAKRSSSDKIRAVAGSCFEKVREGTALASALQSSSKSFSPLYCNLVSAGEVSGALGEILKRQVRYLLTLADLRAKLITALVYPAFLVVSGVAVAGMFIFVLIPRLERLVTATGGELPPVARLLVGGSEVVRNQWILLLTGFAILCVLGWIVWHNPGYRAHWNRIVLRVPLFGRMIRTRFNVQFVETLSNLLNNGMPLVRSLELVEGTASNLFIRKRIREIVEAVSEGSALARAMERVGIFDSGLIDMTRIGEDTGALASSLSKAGERLDREFSRSIDRIVSFIQPLIILAMALAVGVMAYVMISVVYDTIGMLRSR